MRLIVTQIQGVKREIHWKTRALTMTRNTQSTNRENRRTKGGQRHQIEKKKRGNGVRKKGKRKRRI